MIVRLLVANDKANVKKVVLRSDTIVGRSSNCNLRIASNEVSRQHCSILLSELPVRVRDLGSSNGTLLNGKKIQANTDVPLPSGSELEIGSVRFVVQYHVPLDAEDPGSTAEVDNGELIARLNEPAAKPAPPEPAVVETPAEEAVAEEPPPEIHRPAVAENPSETIEQETASDSASDTVNEVFDTEQPVVEQQETFEEEFDEEETELTAADPEETVSFDGSEFPTFDEPAAPDEFAAPETPSPTSAQPARKKGGWKSLFGMFRKSQPAEDAAPEESVAADTSGEETVADLADAAQLDETIRMPPEETGEPIAEAPQNLDETIAMPFDDDVAADEDTGDSGTAIHTDESVVPDVEASETAEPAETDDENLQDFFQRLSQD